LIIIAALKIAVKLKSWQDRIEGKSAGAGLSVHACQ